MGELRFNTGVLVWNVNDTTEISFNPASQQFIERFLDMMEKCLKINEAEDGKKDGKDRREAFRTGRKKDAEISAEIDGLFGDGKAAQLFTWGPTAWADGVPVWFRFAMEILRVIKGEVTTQKAQTSSRLEEYMEMFKEYLN